MNAENLFDDDKIINPKSEGVIIGEALEVNFGKLPPGYKMLGRQVLLLNGNIDVAYYSVNEKHHPNKERAERLKAALIEGFIWALTAEFQDGENDDDDRSQEIGNMIGFALTKGFTQEQIEEAYKEAVALARATSQN